MEGFKYVDIFATKGIEYLFVIGFLILFVVYWKFLNKPMQNIGRNIKKIVVDWFQLAEDYYYHQGHVWAVPEDKQTIRVGLDDFAQKMLGKAQKIELPPPGTKITQGEKSIKINVDNCLIDVLAPVSGEVVAVNQKALENPEIVNQSPYGEGWLYKVKTGKLRRNFNNLFHSRMAKDWMHETAVEVSGLMSKEPGLVLQDGGEIIPGFIKEISPENWDKLARKMLLTDDVK